MFLRTTLKTTTQSVFHKTLLNIFETMSIDNSPAIAGLMKRLTDAEKSIRLLKVEVLGIRRELSKLSSGTSKSVKRFEPETELDGPVEKKRRHDFDTQGDYTIVYTDGACSSNGKKGAKAGIGVWWGDGHPLNTAKPATRNTNNSAEIQACTEACKLAAENGIDKLLIRTDSNFVIKCITEWIKRWKKNDWKTAAGKPVINKDDIIELEKYSNCLSDVKYEHVSGHSGIKGNEGADRLAVSGAEMNN